MNSTVAQPQTAPNTLPANFNFGAGSPAPSPETNSAPATLPANFNFGQSQSQVPQQQSLGQMFSKAFSGTIAGLKQIGSGFGQTVEGTQKGSISEIGRGALNEAAGGINTLFSPITNVINNIGDLPITKNETVGSLIQDKAVQPIADVINKLPIVSPALQQLMTTFPHADEVAGNLITIGLALGLANKSGQLQGSSGEGEPLSGFETPEKAKANIANSQAMNVQDSIANGEIPREMIYQGDTNQLTPEFAQGRINDIAQKLDQVKPGLGDEFKQGLNVNNIKMEGNVPEELVTKANNLIDRVATENPEVFSAKDQAQTPKLSPKQQQVFDQRVTGLQSVVDRYPSSVSNAVDAAKAKGFSPLEDISSDDRFMPTVDNNGTIDSSQAIKNLNDYVKPIAKIERQAIEAEDKGIPFTEFKDAVMDELKNSNLIERGASYDTISSRIEKDLEVYKSNFVDEDGNIKLTKLDDIKDAKYRIVNWNNEDAQIADKTVARAARSVVTDNIENADIDALNKKMSQYYSARDVLDAMDGKKVQGGRLGKYFSRTIGTIIGSHFGPIGAVLGGEVGSRIEGALMQNKFGIPNAGINLEKPNILTQTENSLSTPPKQLKASETVSGKIFDKYNSTPGKQGGYFKMPSKIHPDDLATMRDFNDYVYGDYTPSQKMIVDLEIAARRIAEKYGITSPDVSNRVLANSFGTVLDAKLNLNNKTKSPNPPQPTYK